MCKRRERVEVTANFTDKVSEQGLGVATGLAAKTSDEIDICLLSARLFRVRERQLGPSFASEVINTLGQAAATAIGEFESPFEVNVTPPELLVDSLDVLSQGSTLEQRSERKLPHPCS